MIEVTSKGSQKARWEFVALSTNDSCHTVYPWFQNIPAVSRSAVSPFFSWHEGLPLHRSPPTLHPPDVYITVVYIVLLSRKFTDIISRYTYKVVLSDQPHTSQPGEQGYFFTYYTELCRLYLIVNGNRKRWIVWFYSARVTNWIVAPTIQYCCTIYVYM